MITVAHFMRTYGVHGGETQLAQLLSKDSDPMLNEWFFFLYKDEVCEKYYRNKLKSGIETIFPLSIKVCLGKIFDFSILILLMPILSIRLMKTLEKRKVRVCIVHGFHAAVSAWLAALLCQKCKFVYVHRGNKSKAGRFFIFKLLYWPFDRLCAVSLSSAKSMFGVSGGREVIVLQNGIEVDSMDARYVTANRWKSNIVISTVGRLISSKHHKFIINSFIMFNKKYPMSELWIIGDGNELENLKLFCSQNNLSEQIKFLGYCEDVMSLLCQSDIYVFASESEGLSNAVLEAMAVGLPSVVVDAPGVSECHIDCQSGFVVPRNIKIFCEKLEILASDQKLRRSMGDAARLRIKNEYSISASRKRYLNLYDEVMRSGSCVES